MFSTPIAKRGVFRLHEKPDNKGQASLVGFKKTGPTNSLRVILRRTSDGYELCKKGEYWLLEYYEDDTKGFAWAEPIERVSLEAEYLFTATLDEGTVVGRRYSLVSETEGTDYRVIKLEAKLPKTRKLSKWVLDILKSKIKAFKLKAYEEEILRDFEESLHEIVQVEDEAHQAIEDAAKYLELADDPVEGKETRVVSKQMLRIKLRNLVNPYLEGIPSREELVSTALDEFKILQYDKTLQGFIVEK